MQIKAPANLISRQGFAEDLQHCKIIAILHKLSPKISPSHSLRAFEMECSVFALVLLVFGMVYFVFESIHLVFRMVCLVFGSKSHPLMAYGKLQQLM